MTSAPSTVRIKTTSLTDSSPTPKPQEIPQILIDRPKNEESTIINVPTNQITPSHAFHRHRLTSHLDRQPSQLPPSQTVSDAKPGTIGLITTVSGDRDVSTTLSLGNTNTIGVFPTLTSAEPSATISTSNTGSLLPTNALEPDVDLPDFGGNPPTIQGIDEAVSFKTTYKQEIYIKSCCCVHIIIINSCLSREKMEKLTQR